jgi:hypothetical protein
LALQLVAFHALSSRFGFPHQELNALILHFLSKGCCIFCNDRLLKTNVLCGKSQKTHLLASGMNGKQGLGDAIPIKGFFLWKMPHSLLWGSSLNSDLARLPTPFTAFGLDIRRNP